MGLRLVEEQLVDEAGKTTPALDLLLERASALVQRERMVGNLLEPPGLSAA